MHLQSFSSSVLTLLLHRHKQQQQEQHEHLDKTNAPKKLNPPGLDVHDPVVRVRVQSFWLGHGAVAAAGSVVTQLVTRHALTHWWVEIETASGAWYCAQFRKPYIELTKHPSQEHVVKRAKWAVLKNSRKKQKRVWTNYDSIKEQKQQQCCARIFRTKTMQSVVDLMSSYEGKYNLIQNNCQDFGKWLFRKLVVDDNKY